MTLPQSLLGQLNGNKLFSIIEDQEFGNFICKPAGKQEFTLIWREDVVRYGRS